MKSNKFVHDHVSYGFKLGANLLGLAERNGNINLRAADILILFLDCSFILLHSVHDAVGQTHA